MKFVHAADIHLDSALSGLRRAGAVPAHVTANCTRRALANVVDLAIEEDVAFVVIAGDLYDADWKDFATGLYFAGEMRRLARPCFVARGNHDAASVITRGLVPPPNVRVFSERKAETFLDVAEVAVHGRSFPNRKVPEDLSADYPPPVAGRLNIGVLHSSAEDPGEHETYAPCSVASLAMKGYDYWALGHIHQRRMLHANPPVVFPGNIQGRHPNETGAKGVMLVEARDGRVVDHTFRATDVLRWAQVAVDVAGADSTAEIVARCRVDLAAAMEGAEGRPLIVRLTLSGATPRHAALLADRAALDAECRNAAAAVSGDLHIERVRLATAAPPDRPAAGQDAMALLATAFQAGLDDAATVAELLKDFRALATSMPAQAAGGAVLPTTAEELRALAAEAWPMVAQSLGGDAA